MIFTEAVIEEIKRGKKLQAIKLFREENSVSLKVAKEAIEDYMNNHAEIKAAFDNHKAVGLSQERILQITILLIAAVIIIVII